MVVATVAQGMQLIAPSPIVQPISESLGLTLGQTTGIMLVSFTICVALFGILGGVIVDRIGLPKMYIAATVLMIIGSIIVFIASNVVPVIIIGRVIAGIGCGPVIAVTAKLAADWFPKAQRAIVAGISGGSLSLGITLGLNVCPGVFTASGNWNLAIAMTGILSIPALILAVIFLKGPEPPRQEETFVNDEMLKAGESLFKIAAKLPALYAGIAGGFTLSWVMQAYNDLTPGNLAVDAPVGLGYGPVAAGMIMGLYSLAFMIGSFGCGFIMHGIFKDCARVFVPICFVLTAIFCATVLVPGIAGNQGALLVCLIIAGFFMGMPQASIQGFIAINYPESIQGKVGGMTMGIGIFGGSVGVAVGSVCLHMTGTYRMSVIVVVVVAIVGAVFTALLKEPGVFKKDA
jgi:MFS family permease